MKAVRIERFTQQILGSEVSDVEFEVNSEDAEVLRVALVLSRSPNEAPELLIYIRDDVDLGEGSYRLRLVVVRLSSAYVITPEECGEYSHSFGFNGSTYLVFYHSSRSPAGQRGQSAATVLPHPSSDAGAPLCIPPESEAPTSSLPADQQPPVASPRPSPLSEQQPQRSSSAATPGPQRRRRPI